MSRISLDETSHFDMEGFSGNVYIPTESGLGFNALEVQVSGRHYKTKVKDVKRVYLVLEGEGTFTIEQETFQVKPGDLYLIEAGQVYEYQGKMRLFEFNVPGATEDNEEKLD